jgi:hypothetical protein
MNVRISQSRNGSSTLEIEGFRVGTRQSSNLVGRSSGNDAPAGTGYCLKDRTICGKSTNLAAVQNQIGIR